MNAHQIKKTLLGAAMAGIIAGTTLLGGCTGGKNSDQPNAERNGCNGPNGCGGKDGKGEKNSCSGPNGCNGKAGEKNSCSGHNGCDGKSGEKK
jgi:hypothetical protein